MKDGADQGGAPEVIDVLVVDHVTVKVLPIGVAVLCHELMQSLIHELGGECEGEAVYDPC